MSGRFVVADYPAMLTLGEAAVRAREAGRGADVFQFVPYLGIEPQLVGYIDPLGYYWRNQAQAARAAARAKVRT